MTRTAIPVLVMVGAFTVLLMVVLVAIVDLDREGLRGIAIGAGFGLTNLVLGYLVIRLTLRRGMKAAMATVAGGFIARLLVVAVLTVLFQRTGAADPAAFALTFLAFFFVYVGVEVVLVERSLETKKSLDAEKPVDEGQSPDAEQSSGGTRSAV